MKPQSVFSCVHISMQNERIYYVERECVMCISFIHLMVVLSFDVRCATRMLNCISLIFLFFAYQTQTTLHLHYSVWKHGWFCGNNFWTFNNFFWIHNLLDCIKHLITKQNKQFYIIIIKIQWTFPPFCYSLYTVQGLNSTQMQMKELFQRLKWWTRVLLNTNIPVTMFNRNCGEKQDLIACVCMQWTVNLLMVQYKELVRLYY